THDVRDGDNLGTGLTGHAHGGEGVGGFSGLCDADDDVVLAQDRVAVAVFGGDVHLDGNTRPVLDHVATDQARVVRRAAGDDHNAIGGREVFVGQEVWPEVHRFVVDHAVGD